jgi:hypothetical protein
VENLASAGMIPFAVAETAEFTGYAGAFNSYLAVFIYLLLFHF